MAAGGEKRRGSRNGASKLTADQVLDIRRRYIYRKNTGLLAREFGVSMTTIRAYVSGELWGWLDDDGHSENSSGLRDFNG